MRDTKVIRICSFPIGSIFDNRCLCLSTPCQVNSIIDTAAQTKGNIRTCCFFLVIHSSAGSSERPLFFQDSIITWREDDLPNFSAYSHHHVNLLPRGIRIFPALHIIMDS